MTIVVNPLLRPRVQRCTAPHSERLQDLVVTLWVWPGPYAV